jgi:hypothetical protein
LGVGLEICCLTTGLGVSRGRAAGRCGGLTGSYAGLSGAATSGPGVDGVEWVAHLVPNPLVTDPEGGAMGVWGGMGMAMGRFTGPGVLAACRIMCSGMGGRGGWPAYGEAYGLSLEPGGTVVAVEGCDGVC